MSDKYTIEQFEYRADTIAVVESNTNAIICESTSIDDARLICKLLNENDKPKGLNLIDSELFLHRKLFYLVEIFPTIKCAYEFVSQKNSHRIEIKPTELFLTDKIYLDIEHKIYSEFLNKFPNEGLSFISQEKTFILKPTFIITGKEFKE